MEGPDYFTIEALHGKIYCTTEPASAIRHMYETEWLFDKTFEEIRRELSPHGWLGFYIFPLSAYLYRAKSDDCGYELIGITAGAEPRSTILHFLRKKSNSNNID